MKKLLLIIIALFVLIPSVYAKEKVTISVFYSDSCIHCKHLHEYLDELSKDSKYGKMFNIDYYEIHDKSNSEIFNKTIAYFKKTSTGVPFYVIGDTYEIGFPNPETMQEEYEKQDLEIKKQIEKSYQNNSKNIVKDIKEGKVKVTTTEKQTIPLVQEDRENLEKSNKKVNNNYIYLGVIPVLLIVIIIYAIIAKKKEV
jgi:thiol-disulfide isomerase/thioredoxin